MKQKLKQWPIQIKLIDPNHPAFNENDLLIAADCCAYADSEFHQKFSENTILIGCPKLDDIDYSIKLKEVLTNNDIKKVTVVRMIVPCCYGIENMVRNAIKESGKDIELETYVIGIEGDLVEQ